MDRSFGRVNVHARATTADAAGRAADDAWLRRIVASALYAAPLALWTAIGLRALVLALVTLRPRPNPLEAPLLLAVLAAAWWLRLASRGLRAVGPSWLDRDFPLVAAGLALSAGLIACALM